MLLGLSVHEVGERNANLWYSDEVAENIFPWGQGRMAGQTEPNMHLSLKVTYLPLRG